MTSQDYCKFPKKYIINILLQFTGLLKPGILRTKSCSQSPAYTLSLLTVESLPRY